MDITRFRIIFIPHTIDFQYHLYCRKNDHMMNDAQVNVPMPTYLRRTGFYQELEEIKIKAIEKHQYWM